MSLSTTVRVNRETHERLVTLADATGRRIQTIVEDAVAAYEADMFWTAFDAGYQRLAAESEEWAEIEAERSGEASTLTDHLGETSSRSPRSG
jgi:predicted transcriptional regulator